MGHTEDQFWGPSVKEAKVSEEQTPYDAMARQYREAGGAVPREQPPMSRERFRQEAAIAAMAAMLNAPEEYTKDEATRYALERADALLAELDRTRG